MKNKQPSKRKPREVDQPRCPHMFPEHGSHARQQCIRQAGHPGAHHCAGIKKGQGGQ